MIDTTESVSELNNFCSHIQYVLAENISIKDQNRVLKHALITILLDKKNRGQISGMNTMGRAYIDFDRIDIINGMQSCELKTNGKRIKSWDEVPRTFRGKNEKVSELYKKKAK